VAAPFHDLPSFLHFKSGSGLLLVVIVILSSVCDREPFPRIREGCSEGLFYIRQYQEEKQRKTLAAFAVLLAKVQSSFPGVCTVSGEGKEAFVPALCPVGVQE
jgi:hypothetical protein